METTVRVAETFASLQGESTRAGLPCFFIRLAGCNLRCCYCDTPAARAAGCATAVSELVGAAAAAGLPLVEVTGGEPLLQPGTAELLDALAGREGWTVLVETNGSCDLAVVPPAVTAVVDVKCPGSGAGGSFLADNLGRLRPQDELKFVVGDRADFDWALDFVRTRDLSRRCAAVLFSPVHGRLAPSELAGWLLDARAPVRLQLQLHKILHMP